jgi:predicted TIM-barrel fold metal-dependent hydrolase
MDRHGVDVSVVQPFPGAPDPAAVHDMIAALGREHPGRIFGMASLNPHQDHGAYRAELERAVRDLGFVGVKAHALGHAINPRSKDARMIFQTAADLGIPVMVHTGHGVPFAEPVMWLPLAREFADTTVILGHAGAPMFTGPAIVAGEVASNIVLETSWCSPHDIGRAIKALGAERVLFGSDLHFNPGVELAKYRAIGLTDDVLRLTLAENALRVFGIASSVVV